MSWKSKRIENGKERPIYLSTIPSGYCKSCANIISSKDRYAKKYSESDIVYISNKGESVKVLGKAFLQNYRLVQSDSGVKFIVNKGLLSTGSFTVPIITYEEGDIYVDNYGVEYKVIFVDKDTDNISIKCIKTSFVIKNLYTSYLNRGNIEYSKSIMKRYSFVLSDGKEIEIGDISTPSVFNIYVDGILYHVNRSHNQTLGNFIHDDPVGFINRLIRNHSIKLYKDMPLLNIAHMSFWSKEGFLINIIKKLDTYTYRVDIWGEICDVQIYSVKHAVEKKELRVTGLPFVRNGGLFRYYFIGWYLIDEVLNEGLGDVYWRCRREGQETFHYLRPTDIIHIERRNGKIEDLDRVDLSYVPTKRSWGRKFISNEGIPYIIQEVLEDKKCTVLTEDGEKFNCSLSHACQGDLHITRVTTRGQQQNYNSQGFLVKRELSEQGSHEGLVTFFGEDDKVVYCSTEKDEFGNWYKGCLYPKASTNAPYFSYKGYKFHERCSYLGGENAYYLCTREGLNDVICLRPIDAYKISKGILSEGEAARANAKYYAEPDRYGIGKTGISKDGYRFKIIERKRRDSNPTSRNSLYVLAFEDGLIKEVGSTTLHQKAVKHG